LRVVLFSGFVLCDDRQELWTSLHVFASGPALSGQFQLRFGTWLFNVAAFKLFGISEFGFFVTTVLMSASLSVVGYAMLLRWGYALLPAFAAALMIAAAPFEILMGTVRANDVILAWLVGLAMVALVVLDERPVRQRPLRRGAGARAEARRNVRAPARRQLPHGRARLGALRLLRLVRPPARVLPQLGRVRPLLLDAAHLPLSGAAVLPDDAPSRE